MDLFSNYEQDFVDTLNALQNLLQDMPSLTADQRLEKIRKADRDIKDAEDTLQSMNLNARNVPGPQGAKLQTRIREYEGELAKVKKDIKRSEQQANELAARESLMGGSAVLTDMSVSLDQRERLLNNQERMQRGSNQLKGALRTVEETIEVGTGIMSNLQDQRTTMERGLDRLRGINDKISRSSKIISGMARRVATNKLIMALIVLVLLGAIVLIIWLKWFRKTDDSSAAQ
jgi:vesicle transport through interaction with t-SNAREs protein 1